MPLYFPGSDEPSHTMTLQSTDPDTQAEHWLCQTCGREFLVEWEPHYHKTILAAGDELASHSGSKGLGEGAQLTIGASYASFEEPAAPEPESLEGAGEGPLDGPFQDWLERRKS